MHIVRSRQSASLKSQQQQSSQHKNWGSCTSATDSQGSSTRNMSPNKVTARERISNSIDLNVFTYKCWLLGMPTFLWKTLSSIFKRICSTQPCALHLKTMMTHDDNRYALSSNTEQHLKKQCGVLSATYDPLGVSNIKHLQNDAKKKYTKRHQLKSLKTVWVSCEYTTIQ